MQPYEKQHAYPYGIAETEQQGRVSGGAAEMTAASFAGACMPTSLGGWRQRVILAVSTEPRPPARVSSNGRLESRAGLGRKSRVIASMPVGFDHATTRRLVDSADHRLPTRPAGTPSTMTSAPHAGARRRGLRQVSRQYRRRLRRGSAGRRGGRPPRQGLRHNPAPPAPVPGPDAYVGRQALEPGRELHCDVVRNKVTGGVTHAGPFAPPRCRQASPGSGSRPAAGGWTCRRTPTILLPTDSLATISLADIMLRKAGGNWVSGDRFFDREGDIESLTERAPTVGIRCSRHSAWARRA